MPTVLVTHSESHPMALETIDEVFDGWAVRDLEVPAGGLQKRVDDELIAALDGCDALVLRPGTVTESVLEAATDLRAIALLGSGYDHVDVAAATENGVAVIHSPENPAPSVVEHTFGLMFTLLRDLPRRFELTRLGRWGEARSDVVELNAITVGVLGLGTIGFEVARTARGAFDASVVAHDPYVTGDRSSDIYPRIDRRTVEDAGIRLIDFDSVFERADLVTVHTPLTEETRGFVGIEEFERLAGGYFVNTSRGEVVDESGLLEAMERRLLRGVALDVFESEPPDPANPLLEFDNVYVTPHVAGAGTVLTERSIRNVRAKLDRVLKGNRPDYVVNPDVFDR